MQSILEDPSLNEHQKQILYSQALNNYQTYMVKAEKKIAGHPPPLLPLMSPTEAATNNAARTPQQQQQQQQLLTPLLLAIM